MSHIIENIAQIRKRIAEAALGAGRNPEEVKLLLATKTVSSENIKIALESGEHLIGENRAQELKSKYNDLLDVPHQKHFIGHLQTNKIKELLRYDVTCIQSVDRLDLAEKLQARLEFEKKEIDVFIQVNTSNEESKFGVAPENAIELTKQVAKLPNIHIKGLMTIGLFSAEEAKVRVCFKLLKDIQQQIAALNLPRVEMNELSMGMSHDLEFAIEEGSTMVRVGTAIFGQRIYADSYYWNESK
ncbi:MAG TPA: YggS family pyridoxal phosphate-dependent enzyme [Dysgonamonadaceae bacterium]|nr:YggS family pyridoxal phosphate-dependent enzyme [Dysgonamonadaceae bacterium]